MAGTRVNWRQAAGDAVLIFLGVVLAMFGQAWWENRVERGFERNLVEGLLGDLARDSADIANATLAATRRAAGADELLLSMGVPARDVITRMVGEGLFPAFVGENAESELHRVRAAVPEGSLPPAAALAQLGLVQRFDLADTRYSEATATGRLDVIRDSELRRLIADYYFDANRRGPTNEEQMNENAQQVRSRLSDVGLSPSAPPSDDAVLRVLTQNPTLAADLINVRAFALIQIRRLALIAADRDALARRLEAWLREHE